MSENIENSEQGAALPAEGALQQLAPGGTFGARGEINFDLLSEVPVTLSVEIGRARMPIKELLSLNQGAVVELDREVNAPLDLMVNGTLIARGEVVELDGRFGLRLIDVVSPSERLKKAR